MGKPRKVRCPHCKQVNEIDVDRELELHGKTVIMRRTGSTPPKRPKSITVTCVKCSKRFTIDL